MKLKNKKWQLLLAIPLLLIFLVACNDKESKKTTSTSGDVKLLKEPYKKEEFLMGTYVRVQIFDEGKEDVLDKTFDRIKELDKKIDESFPSFGMVLDNDGLYDRLNCYDNLELYARIYSISNRKKVINDLLEKVGLIESSKKSVSNLSKGMRQRLSFARAILHSPKIVFLDEPTSGLDPATTLQIHSMMKMLKESGTTIFLTTHNMNEAQKMCDHLALLNEGNIVEEGTPEDICLHHRKKCEVNIEMTNGEKYMVDSHDLLTVLQTVLDTNNKIRSIHSNEPNLEEVFIELTGRDLR